MSASITITFDAALLDVTVNSVTYQIDLTKPIPNESLVELFRYGTQRKVNDACGGKDKTDSAKAEIAKAKIAAIYDGTIAERVRNGEPAEPAIMYYVRDVIRTKLGEVSRKEYKALEADKRKEWLNAKYAALATSNVAAHAAITAQAQANMETALAAANRVKAMELSL